MIRHCSIFDKKMKHAQSNLYITHTTISLLILLESLMSQHASSPLFVGSNIPCMMRTNSPTLYTTLKNAINYNSSYDTYYKISFIFSRSILFCIMQRFHKSTIQLHRSTHPLRLMRMILRSSIHTLRCTILICAWFLS